MLGLFTKKQKKITFELKAPDRDKLVVFSSTSASPAYRDVMSTVRKHIEMGICPHRMAEALYTIADNLVTGDFGKNQFETDKEGK